MGTLGFVTLALLKVVLLLVLACLAYTFAWWLLVALVMLLTQKRFKGLRGDHAAVFGIFSGIAHTLFYVIYTYF